MRVKCFWMIKPMVVVLFYWRLMLFWVMAVGFENTAQLQESEMSPRFSFLVLLKEN